MRAALVCIGFAMLAGAHADGEWIEFSRGGSGLAYFDQSTIQPDRGRDIAYFAWWRTALNAPATMEGKQYTSHLAQYRVDCLRCSLQQRQMFFFSVTGSQIASDGSTGETVPMPGTMGETFVKAICARVGR